MIPVVAIVGRPNVGKSSLFNRLIGRKKALVNEIAGLTRDRLYGETTWNKITFNLIDTGGYHFDESDRFLQEIRSQIHLAIESAAVIIFLVEARISPTPAEIAIAKLLHKSRKPVLLAINKVDQPEKIHDDQIFYNGFQKLGFKNYILVSTLHGLNINTLLDQTTKILPKIPAEKKKSNDKSIPVAVVGKPNVGKSSLVNALLNQERVIVSDIPGTTRDSIDTYFEAKEHSFTLIDTAGIKKAKEHEDVAEILSIISAIKSIERAGVVLLVLDGEKGITAQDQRIADLTQEKKCACVIVLNKWDVVQKDYCTFDQYSAFIREKLRFLHYASILPVSAKTHDRINTIVPKIIQVYERYQLTIAQSHLNDILLEALGQNPAGHIKRKIIRIYALEQISTAPPLFRVVTNETEEFPRNYLRYLENKIRLYYPLEGIPIKFQLKRKGT